MEFPDINKMQIVMRLWDCGFQSTDRERLISELAFSEEEADEICKVLQGLESREGIEDY